MTRTYLGKIVETIEPVNTIARELDGKKYLINFIDDSTLRKSGVYLSGYAYKGKIYIRLGLPKRVEQAVFRHEVYHLDDKHRWLGKYGMEMRAHAHTILHDPFGFLLVLLHSLNFRYIKTFWRLYIWPKNPS
ncbi:MAG TPA: hypothetical protein PKB09_01805 [Candidatus Saccharibacteria bacterium]|nr:hypothetical protein [Candidatus Saccharibacteria bacterium]